MEVIPEVKSEEYNDSIIENEELLEEKEYIN